MEEISTLRKRAGLSQQSFAELLGVAQSTVSRWETGALVPSELEIRGIRQLIDEKFPADSRLAAA